MRLDAACSGLCKRRPYHRHPFSLFHQLALLTSAPAHVAGGERRPILRLRHCLPSWFTVHSQAMLHFPQSPRHGQRAQQPMPRASGLYCSLFTRHCAELLRATRHCAFFSSWLFVSGMPNDDLISLRSLMDPLGHAIAYACFRMACVAAMSMVKSATNAVFAEVALLEPFGLFRTVALAWTEGLNTWASHAWLDFHAMVVPVGVSTLGRLINVVGSAIDPFLD